MKDFIKVAKNIFPYWRYAALNITLNIFSVFFALFSLTMIIPLLGILFKTQPLVTNPGSFEFSTTSIINHFNYFLSSIIIEKGQISALIVVCVMVIVMSLLKNLFAYMAVFFLSPIMNGVVRDYQRKIYHKVLSLPLAFFSDERRGDIMARFTSDVQEVKFSIQSSLDLIFRDPITIVIYITSLFVMSPKLTGFVLIFLPVMGLIIGTIGKKLRNEGLAGQKKMGDLMSVFDETMGGLRIIKSFNAESKMKRRFFIHNTLYYKITNTIYRRRSLASPMGEFLGTIAVVIIMWFGGTLVLNNQGSLNAQEFITYLAIFSQVITPAKSLSNAYYNIQKGMASVQRIESILDAELKIHEKPEAITKRTFEHCIEYKNVSFAYKNEYVLKNINLKIEKGKTIALVGQSGSGKSTLVDLLPRFYDIVEGDILIDGVSVKDIKLQDLRHLMGIVSQEAILFNDTFENNIMFGVNGAKPDEIEAAAKVANAHDFIIETENGYQTSIGERGGKISGGQKQRISIARAVLKNPPILILDEATSALDTESEKLVQDAITKLMQNRTSIVIAHRLSTIRNADEICVFHKGEIVERGKHEELIAMNGMYNKLYYLQN